MRRGPKSAESAPDVVETRPNSVEHCSNVADATPEVTEASPRLVEKSSRASCDGPDRNSCEIEMEMNTPKLQRPPPQQTKTGSRCPGVGFAELGCGRGESVQPTHFDATELDLSVGLGRLRHTMFAQIRRGRTRPGLLCVRTWGPFFRPHLVESVGICHRVVLHVGVAGHLRFGHGAPPPHAQAVLGRSGVGAELADPRPDLVHPTPSLVDMRPNWSIREQAGSIRGKLWSIQGQMWWVLRSVRGQMWSIRDQVGSIRGQIWWESDLFDLRPNWSIRGHTHGDRRSWSNRVLEPAGGLGSQAQAPLRRVPPCAQRGKFVASQQLEKAETRRMTPHDSLAVWRLILHVRMLVFMWRAPTSVCSCVAGAPTRLDIAVRENSCGP